MGWQQSLKSPICVQKHLASLKISPWPNKTNTRHGLQKANKKNQDEPSDANFVWRVRVPKKRTLLEENPKEDI